MALPTDVWYVPTINAMSKERTGYPTQKPLALLQRIILASSNEGDVVFDPFCGCSTTCVAAQQLKRKWIGIDIEKQAVKILKQRLSAEAEHCEDFVVTDKIPNRTDIREIGPSPYIKKRLYQDQAECCHACGEHFELQDLDIYHIIPKSQGGGGDYYENYQLLCKSCNRIKSNHLMEYLRLKLERSQNQTQQTLVFGE